MAVFHVLAEMARNMRFKRKLFISYLVVMIIPLAILGVYSYLQAEKFLLNEAKLGLNESISQVADNLDAKFKRYDNVMYFVTYNSQILGIIDNEDASYFQKYVDYTEVLDPFFATVQSLNNEIDSLSVYTSNEHITERTNSIQSLQRIASEPWLGAVKRDWRVHWVAENGSLIGLTRFYEPFADAPLNILYAKMDYDSVFDMDMGSAREFSIFVTDASTGANLYEQNVGGAHVADMGEKVAELPEGEIKLDGVAYLSIKKPIEATGWTLSYVTPVSAIAIDAGKIVGAMVVIILACLVFLVLITWFFTHTFVKRIYSLNRQMKLVENGNLQIAVSSGYKDEVGELTNRFGRMLASINALIDESYRSKIIQKEAEMKVLQAQINPHFLYNTLSLINWKAIEIDATEISLITRNVSKFYRGILNKGKDVISVVEEIAIVKSYVDIQLAMHGHSFQVEYEFADDMHGCDMLKLILQPIVENAIEHGIDLLPAGSGRLSVTGTMEEDGLEFRVADNGPGMDKPVLERILSEDAGGYGLKNVQARLQIFFGPEYGIGIASEPGQGTVVTVRIPRYQASERPVQAASET